MADQPDVRLHRASLPHDKCTYCGDPHPDHPGRSCPHKTIYTIMVVPKDLHKCTYCGHSENHVPQLPVAGGTTAGRGSNDVQEDAHPPDDEVDTEANLPFKKCPQKERLRGAPGWDSVPELPDNLVEDVDRYPHHHEYYHGTVVHNHYYAGTTGPTWFQRSLNHGPPAGPDPLQPVSYRGAATSTSRPLTPFELAEAREGPHRNAGTRSRSRSR